MEKSSSAITGKSAIRVIRNQVEFEINIVSDEGLVVRTEIRIEAMEVVTRVERLDEKLRVLANEVKIQTISLSRGENLAGLQMVTRRHCSIDVATNNLK